VPPCAVIPVLYYPNPQEAAAWLEKAFGCTVRLRIANHRIQMRLGEGCLKVAEGNIVPNGSTAVQVRVVGAQAHCERARHAGAVILRGPQDEVFGERQYTAQDFFGHKWTFTESYADVEPESWGGTSVRL
jgi:uncharacterized glyoxalase superfamily protein PhnB